MTPSRADLLDPSALAALGNLELVARWVVDGFLTGLHRSPRKGFSVEFAEHRPYQPGDDLRYLDWRIAARADRWVVKQFEEETNTRAMLVLDVSASMRWTGAAARLTKLAYAEQMLGALALLMLRQRDAVGLVRADDSLRSVVPPSSRTGQWFRLAAALSSPGAGLGSNLVPALAQAVHLVRRPGFVMLVSDLLVDPEPVIEQLRTIRARGHEVLVLHVLDPVERDFPDGAEALFTDPESAASLPATPSEIRDEYQDTVQRALTSWRTSLLQVGARYALAMTDQPYGQPLRALVRASGRGGMPIA
jgi:uncharacterized protein (DUF58 family)